MGDWKQYTIDGVVTMAVPDGTTPRLQDDDTMVVLTLPGEPATDILMGLFPFERGSVVSESTVRARLTEFMDRCVRSVAQVRSMSIEPAADVTDTTLCAWQAVAEID